MKKYYKITIKTTSLCRDKWVVIYQIVSKFYNGTLTVGTLNAYYVGTEKPSETNSTEKYISNTEYIDGCPDRAKELSIEEIPANNKETTFFSIIYEKQDAKEDLSELAYFALLDDEQNEKRLPQIILEIDVDKLTLQEQSEYSFKLADFFRFRLPGEWKELFGISSQISLLNKKIKRENGIGTIDRSKLPYKDSISIKIIPLLTIDEKNYKEVFGNKKSDEYTSNVAGYFCESLSKIKTTYTSGTTDRLFEKWFINAYYYSLDESDIPRENEREPLNIALRGYSNYIYELVQNIIFHTEKKKGLLYIIFNKKENISDSRLKHIPYFDAYTDTQRFIEIGIFDRNDVGIVQNYNNKNQNDIRSELMDFFRQKPSESEDLTRLHLRNLAHLGIKTFVKSVILHNGYFWVESNKHNSSVGIKQIVETCFDTSTCKITVNPENDVLFIDGTHYEIIIPVVSEQVSPMGSSINMQSSSFIKKLHDCRHISNIKPITIDIRDFGVVSKEEQKSLIVNIGNEIISQSGNTAEIAIDIKNRENEIDEKLLIKILSYLQLFSEIKIDRILLVKLKSELIERICSLVKTILIDGGCQQIWSNETAVILMSTNFHYQIICGADANTLYYLNDEYHKLYPQGQNFFVSDGNFKIGESEVNLKKRFISPYEMWVTEDNGISLFESNVRELLDKPIESVSIEDAGYMLDVHTYIGNKLILNHFYEADSLFQNSFYAQRFAYSIAKNIYTSFKDAEKKLVLVGYKHYSELLVHSIKEILLDLFKSDEEKSKSDEKKSKSDKKKSESFQNLMDIIVCIAHEKENNRFYFSFENDDDKSKMDTKPGDYFCAIIIPIGSTLSTNDKVIAFFKRALKFDISDRIFYNHSVILIRDNDEGRDITDIETKQKWEGVDKVNKIVNTGYQNLKGKDIHYSVLTSGKSNTTDSTGLWCDLLNDKISFPKEWWREQYVNSTENSSINSQNLMGLPFVHQYREDKKTESYKRTCHEINRDRLKEFKQDIKYGHIESFNTHFQYYFDTKGYLNRCYHPSVEGTASQRSEFDDWLNTLRDQECYRAKRLSVIVTPNTELQSHFVNIINAELFDNLAFVLFVDINNWRNNIIYKLSFLKSFKDVDYHYVDHALRTGERFNKTKSYLHSILDSDNTKTNVFSFKSAVVLINNLSYNRNKEVLGDADGNLFSYIDLFVPPTQESGKECILCAQKNHYEKIRANSVLESCRNILTGKIDALKITEEHILESHRTILSNETKEDVHKSEQELKEISNHDHDFVSLIYTHDIFFKLSALHQGEKINTENYKDEIEKCLNELLVGYINNEDDVSMCRGRRICFFDTITSLPLSRYIHIREYAHSKLLKELSSILELKTYDENTFNYLKDLLHFLSRLKSNTLVRKDVITGVWYFCYRVYSRNFIKINEDYNDSFFPQVSLDKIEDVYRQIEQLKKEFQYYIKCTICDDETKSMYLGELLRTGKEPDIAPTVTISKTINNNPLFFFFDEQIEKDDKSIIIREYFIQQYKQFLVQSFYDNTTILRNTLSNFDKDIRLTDYKSLFDYNGLKAGEFHLFQTQIADAKAYFNAENSGKIEEEYYYSHFKPYVNNPDNIDFTERLLYVLKAQTILNHLIEKRDDTLSSVNVIDNEIGYLLSVLTRVMDAKDAFLSLKNTDDYCYVFRSNMKNAKRKFKKHPILPSNYYTYEKLSQGAYNGQPYPYPFIEKDFTIEDSCTQFGEYTYGENNGIYTGCCLFLIYHDDKLFGTITFLYSDSYSSFSAFRMRCREHGRLLLLIKTDIEKYLIDFLLRKKVFALWIEKSLNKRKYLKLYGKNKHIFDKFVGEEMEVFDGEFTEDQVKNLSRCWYEFTNTVVNFFYSNIHMSNGDRDGYQDDDEVRDEYSVSVSRDTIIDENSTLGKVFTPRFKRFLESLLKDRWYNAEPDHTIVFWNDSDFNAETSIYINKHILRSYIVQCIDNSLKSHCETGNSKELTIEVTDEHILIREKRQIVIPQSLHNKLKNNKTEFGKEKPNITGMKCQHYSSTTLTSLQGIIKWLGQTEQNLPISYSVDYDYDDNLNFFVEIKYIHRL